MDELARFTAQLLARKHGIPLGAAMRQVGLDLGTKQAGTKQAGTNVRKQTLEESLAWQIWRNAVTGDGTVIYASSDAEDSLEHELRSNAARKGARTRRRNSARTLASEPPSDVHAGRPFDGTNARTVDGGTAMHYRAGTSAGYGEKLTESRRGLDVRKRTFTVTLEVRFNRGEPWEPVKSYADDWSSDRTAAEKCARETELAVSLGTYKHYPTRITIGESGSQPVAMPDTSERAPMSVSRGSRARKDTVARDPFDGTYAEFRAAVMPVFWTVAQQLTMGALATDELSRAGQIARTGDRSWQVKCLQPYFLWATRRYKREGGRLWQQAEVTVKAVVQAILAADDAGDLHEIAETLSSADMAWTMPG